MRGLLLVAVLGAATAACSSPATPAPPKSAAATVVLPLDRYSLDDSELDLLDRARNRLIGDCMRRAGFTYPVRDEPVSTPGNTRRYGVSEPASARRFGYHPPPPLLSGRRWTDRLDRYVGGLGPRGQAALFGPAPASGTVATGCAGAADTLSPGAGSDPELVERLGAGTLRRAGQRPEVRAARQRWARCMAAAGLPYDSPDTAAEDRRWAGADPAGPATAEERRTAGQDVDCKLSTGFLATVAAAETAEQRQVVAANAAALARVRAANQAQLGRARQALGS